jgi:hypothetical protein
MPEVSGRVGVRYTLWWERMAQEANALGKARGYADVGPGIGRVEA